ncbi:Fic family protein [Microbacterium sp.]|uniref:Fic family protein n=1 Tax=Microbacterium sp. TaxID=51671 RepID=UPI0039E608AF
MTTARIDALWARYRELAAQHPDALTEIALAEVPEAVHQSNAIENSSLTLDDTERILEGRLPRGTHELREVFEASNLARVTTELLQATEPLTSDLILRWHRELLTGIRDDAAGRFRSSNEWVRVGAHLGANPAFVPELVDRALERYRSGPPDGVLERIAWFHCEFEVIHPFVDGNGRIGRVLINHQLLRQGLPPVIVRARGRHTEYYPALEAYRRTDRHDAMTRLLTLLVLEALHKRLALVTSRDIIPLADWARAAAIRSNVAANKAKRQTIPAFRMRDRWMIAAEYREPTR